MKIIILTVDHIYANIVVKDLIRKYGTDIKLVIISGVILHKQNTWQSLRKYYSVSGAYYFVVQVLKLLIYKFLSILTWEKENKFYSFKKELRKRGIRYQKIIDINSKESVKVLKKLKPDLIVSVFFNQILSSELLETPKKGAINIHPAFLPDYKGVSPVFWALSNGEKFSGVSIHYVNNGIDTGSIIKRKKVKIENTDGEDSLYFKLAKQGSSLLVKAINDIRDNRVKLIPNNGGRYFSIPDKKSVKRFNKVRNFFKLKDYIVN